MKEIKTAGIKELKDNLSAYLRDVKSGVIVLVTDRGKVVALLKEPDIKNLHSGANTIINEWIREGKLIPGNGKKSLFPQSGLSLEKGTAIHLLNEDRGE